VFIDETKMPTVLLQQFLYFWLAAPIGFCAFYLVDWFWFDHTYYAVVSAGIANLFLQLL
jgi:hypothetical protein